MRNRGQAEAGRQERGGEGHDLGGKSSTLPLVFSTHIAFFFWSMHSGPARTEVMVDGGV